MPLGRRCVQDRRERRLAAARLILEQGANAKREIERQCYRPVGGAEAVPVQRSRRERRRNRNQSTDRPAFQEYLTMIRDNIPRRAILVARSHTVSVEAMTEIAGVEPDATRAKGSIRAAAKVQIPAKEHSWQIREYAESEVPLEEVIDRLFKRVLPMRDSFIALREAGCELTLDLVHIMSESDPHGPGFCLETDVVHFLAEIDASVDVDQYLR